jgi:hypothetical protein
MRIHLSGNANNEKWMRITPSRAPLFSAIAVVASMVSQVRLSIEPL